MIKKIGNDVNNSNTTSESHDSEFAKSFTVAGKDLIRALAYKNKIVDAANAETRSILEKVEKITPAPLKVENAKEGVDEVIERLFNLKASYEAQVSRYRRLGWLVEKEMHEREGIIGVDRNFYSLPTLEEIQKTLAEQIELLTYKHSQGFKKFMLVPFGMSYVEMYKKLQKEYKRYAEDPETEGLKLYCSDFNRTRITKFNEVCSVFGPVSKEAELLYYPETLYSTDPNIHHAKSKDALVSENHFSGWELHLITDHLLLDRKRKGETIVDASVFRGVGEGVSRSKEHIYFRDYLELMKGRESKSSRGHKRLKPVYEENGQNVYLGEVGMIPEVWVVTALEELITKNQVINDVGSNNLKAGETLLLGTLVEEGLVAATVVFPDHICLSETDDEYSRHYPVSTSVKVC